MYNFKQKRTELGLTVNEISKTIHISKKQIYRLENNEVGEFSQKHNWEKPLKNNCYECYKNYLELCLEKNT